MQGRTAGGRRGLTLASADPEVHPRIQYQSLKDPHDRVRLAEAVRLATQLLRHEAFKGIIAACLAPTDQALASESSARRLAVADGWQCAPHVRHVQDGASVRSMAVVDQYGRVHGIQGLRVVDASIMPNVTRSNTNATTIMMAERVAAWMQ